MMMTLRLILESNKGVLTKRAFWRHVTTSSGRPSDVEVAERSVDVMAAAEDGASSRQGEG
jgi:hypothetical protein